MQPILKDVLQRLQARRLEATPENFAWACRQILSERGVGLDRQYTTYVAALGHALDTLGDFLVDDEWLASRVDSVRRIIADNTMGEEAQLVRVEEALGAIERGRPAAVRRIKAEAEALRAAIAHAVAEMNELSTSLSQKHVDLDRYEKLALECSGVAEARELVAMLTEDIRKLQAVVDAKGMNAHRDGDRIRERIAKVQPANVIPLRPRQPA